MSESLQNVAMAPQESQLLPPQACCAAFLRHSVQACVDVMAFVAAFIVAYLIASQQGKIPLPERLPNFQPTRLWVFFSLVLVWILWFGWVRQAYSRPRPFWDELLTILKGTVVLAVADLALLAVSKQMFSRTWWAGAWLLLPPLLLLGRRLSRSLLERSGLWDQPTLIFGTGENALQAYLAFRSEPRMGFRVTGFVAADTSAPVALPDRLPLLTWRPDSDAWPALRHTHCVIALEAHQYELRDRLIRQLSRVPVRQVHVIPAMRGVPLHGLESSNFFSHEVLLIHLRNNLANPLHRLVKRTFDLMGAASLLLLLSPLFAVLAYLVSRDGGSPFFAHTRVGQNGRPFGCLKFRSMVMNAEEVLQNLLACDPQARLEWERDFKLKNDPRINNVGRFLRRTSLDELPQLWNVLKGEMSLVGPRPVVEAELARYGDDVDYYLSTRPGMTGLWQVSGRNDLDYETRVYLDAWYVKNWALWSDIAILFKTLKVVLHRDGAY